MDDLVVIVVNYSLAGHIGELLASEALPAGRVLLVDNGSEPGRIKELSHRFGTGLLLLDANLGFAGAVNRAVAAADPCSHILLLNPDVRLTAATVSTLRDELDRTQLTAVSPRLVSDDSTLQLMAGGPVTTASFWIHFLFLNHVFRRARGIFYTRRQLLAGLEPCWLGMACLMLQGDAFARYGPLPEHELVYAEDVAWCTAASRRGARFAVLANVTVSHEQGAAGASACWEGALARLARRRLGPVRGFVAVVALRVGLAARRALGRPLSPRRADADQSGGDPLDAGG